MTKKIDPLPPADDVMRDLFRKVTEQPWVKLGSTLVSEARRGNRNPLDIIHKAVSAAQPDEEKKK